MFDLLVALLIAYLIIIFCLLFPRKACPWRLRHELVAGRPRFAWLNIGIGVCSDNALSMVHGLDCSQPEVTSVNSRRYGSLQLYSASTHRLPRQSDRAVTDVWYHRTPSTAQSFDEISSFPIKRYSNNCASRMTC